MRLSFLVFVGQEVNDTARCSNAGFLGESENNLFYVPEGRGVGEQVRKYCDKLLKYAGSGNVFQDIF